MLPSADPEEAVLILFGEKIRLHRPKSSCLWPSRSEALRLQGLNVHSQNSTTSPARSRSSHGDNFRPHRALPRPSQKAQAQARAGGRAALPGELQLPQSQSAEPPRAPGGSGGGADCPGAGRSLPKCPACVLLGRVRFKRDSCLAWYGRTPVPMR